MVEICLPGPNHSYHQKAPRNLQDRDQHKLQSRSQNISVLMKSGIRCYQERDQHKLESRSRNTSVLMKSGTATPFGIYNIIKGGTSPARSTDSSTTSQKTLYWGPACLTGNHFQTNLRAMRGNIFSQSCKTQNPSKTNACLNQSGMGFAWNLLAGTKPLYHTSCCKTRHMPRTVSRDPVARGHGNTVSLATVQITVRSRHRGRSREGR